MFGYLNRGESHGWSWYSNRITPFCNLYPSRLSLVISSATPHHFTSTKALYHQVVLFFKLTLEPFTPSPLALRLLSLLSGDYNMSSTNNSNTPTTTSPLSIILVLICWTYICMSIFLAMARRTLLPAVHRFLARIQQEQHQQRQQELARRRRLHAHLQRIRLNATAAAAAQRLRDDEEWRAWVAERDRRIATAVEAQEPAVAARRAEEYGARLRRELEADFARLDRIDGVDEEQRFQPAEGSLLFESDGEDPEVDCEEMKAESDG